MVGAQSVSVEVASSEEQRARGLMYRDALAVDEGMLFMYPDDGTRAFWMKNVRFPLSIAFVDSSGKIVRLADMEPYSSDRVSSLYPVRYALEMNLGWFEAHEISPGDYLKELPDLTAR
jgi:uncharacterized membrane protein (UPF0127 family)